MEVKAVTRYVRMSPQKVREVTRQIQGLPVTTAQATLAVVPGKCARLVAKTLKSAVANAENNKSLKPEVLRIKEATSGKGPIMKRFTPKARGSAGPVLKRSSQIRIVLSDE
jgi:large subunit ribosomal protein L22